MIKVLKLTVLKMNVKVLTMEREVRNLAATLALLMEVLNEVGDSDINEDVEDYKTKDVVDDKTEDVEYTGGRGHSNS